MQLYIKFTHMALAAVVLLHYSWNLNLPHFAIWTVQLIQNYQQVMQTVVWLHSVCMWHKQIHQNLKRQQSVNVPTDKMHSYVSQNSYLIPVEGRFAGKTITRDSKNSTVTPANTGHVDAILTTDKIFDRNVAGLLEPMVVSNRQACSLLKNINLSGLQV